MIGKTSFKRVLECPCGEKNWEISHLKENQQVWWTCEKCGFEYFIEILQNHVTIEKTGRQQSPVTITLQAEVTPPITVRINTWKYPHSMNDTPEEYFSNQQYFYESHTCPTNWFSEVKEVECEGDKDPHGLFKLISIEEGHYEDSY